MCLFVVCLLSVCFSCVSHGALCVGCSCGLLWPLSAALCVGRSCKLLWSACRSCFLWHSFSVCCLPPLLLCSHTSVSVATVSGIGALGRVCLLKLGLTRDPAFESRSHLLFFIFAGDKGAQRRFSAPCCTPWSRRRPSRFKLRKSRQRGRVLAKRKLQKNNWPHFFLRPGRRRAARAISPGPCCAPSQFLSQLKLINPSCAWKRKT